MKSPHTILEHNKGVEAKHDSEVWLLGCERCAFFISSTCNMMYYFYKDVEVPRQSLSHPPELKQSVRVRVAIKSDIEHNSKRVYMTLRTTV